MKRTQRKPRLKITSGYLSCVYSVKSLTKIVNRVAEEIENFRKRKRVDAIAFTGTSGAALAYPLSVKMGLPLICIRKEGADSHYYPLYEGVTGAKQYVIVDDCIDSGDTIRRIKKEIKKKCPSAKPVGVFLYNQFYWSRTCAGVPVYPVGE